MITSLKCLRGLWGSILNQISCRRSCYVATMPTDTTLHIVFLNKGFLRLPLPITQLATFPYVRGCFGSHGGGSYARTLGGDTSAGCLGSRPPGNGCA